MVTRRQFIESAFTSVASFSVSACVARSNTTETTLIKVDKLAFPQGVASGDPTASSVVLWVRVDAEYLNLSNHIPVVVEVSERSDFSSLIIRGKVLTSGQSDFTLRFLAKNLTADRKYYYRFSVNDQWMSPTGKTKTAPSVKSSREINFAWASCQDYEAGFYGAWRHLIDSERKGARNKELDFVLHVGDFIYETIGAKFKDQINADYLTDDGYLFDKRSGSIRKISALPSGGTPGRYGGRSATNLEDYRHIYKNYLADPDLQEARANFPFICIWDDHEFSDNGWQSATLSGEDKPLRNAANQAWFEFVPVVYQPELIANDLLYGHELFSEQNTILNENQQTSSNLVLYRQLQFGQTLQLIITDNRLYRSEHLIPESWKEEHFKGIKMPKTSEFLTKVERNRATSGPLTINGIDYPKPVDDDLPASILGKDQKSWWKKCTVESNAVWKVWANSVPFTSVKFDLEPNEPGCDSFVVQSDDSWDGYPSEKLELLNFVEQNKIENLISLSGDFHANIASEFFGSEENSRLALREFAIGALSSVSLFRILKLITPSKSPRAKYLFSGKGVTDKAQLNIRISESDTRHKECGKLNEKITYADAAANGYGVVTANKKEMRVSFIKVENIFAQPSTNSKQGIPVSIKSFNFLNNSVTGGGNG